MIFRMEIASFAEEIKVTAAPPLVNSVSSAVSTSCDADLVWGLRASGVLNLQSGRPCLRLEQVSGPATNKVRSGPALPPPSGAVLAASSSHCRRPGRLPRWARIPSQT